MTTFVAVHGAGTGGWLFDDLAERLTSAGHRVVAPSLFGVGELATPDARSTTVSTHVDQVVALVDSERITGAVLLGFSYGGYVITGVARRVPHAVSRLVYLDAFVPEPGLSLLDQLPPPVRDVIVDAADRFGDGWRIPPPVQAVGGLGALEPGVDPDRVDAVLARRGPHPLGTYTQVTAGGAGPADELPRTYLHCTDKPPGDPMTAQADRARSAGWTVHEIPTGHFAMLTMPTRLAGLLTEAVALGGR